MLKKGKKNTRDRLFNAQELLVSNIKDIDTIYEWAVLVGYDCPKKFSKDYRNQYSRRPKKDMIKIKLQKAISLIENDSDITLYNVAIEIGKKDEKSLHAFFKRHSLNEPSYYRHTGKQN